jgi:hypothetical protein
MRAGHEWREWRKEESDVQQMFAYSSAAGGLLHIAPNSNSHRNGHPSEILFVAHRKCKIFAFV